MFFDNYCESLISGRKTEHEAVSPPKFDVYLIVTPTVHEPRD